MKTTVSLLLVLVMSACAATEPPAFDPLGSAWAAYIAANPGGTKAESEAGRQAVKDAAALEEEGFALYQRKRDEAALVKYEAALKLHASGRLYYRYANSLSNTPRLADSVQAYTIARELGFLENGKVSYNLACALAKLGKNDEAARNLELAVAEGYRSLDYMDKDADLAKLRATAAWPETRRRLAEKAGLKEVDPAAGGVPQYFLKHYAGRILRNTERNAEFGFFPGATFLKDGKGIYRLDPQDGDKQPPSEDIYYMSEFGRFRLAGDTIELRHPHSYMQFERKLRIKPLGPDRIEINGKPFTVAEAASPVDEGMLFGQDE